MAALEPVIDAASRRIERAGVAGRTLTLKVKFADFSVVTRARTSGMSIASRSDIEEGGRETLRLLLPVPIGVRLLGLTLSGFDAPSAVADQLGLLV